MNGIITASRRTAFRAAAEAVNVGPTRGGDVTKRRKALPPEVAVDVLATSRRRCCVCLALASDDAEKNGQIVHLDHDSSNNDPDNLAFLCLEHHDQYDSRTSQSKGLTIGEVKRYRTELHAYVARTVPWSDGEIVAALMPSLDRPAFRTPFHHESSLPRFREAIAETIETLNTGRTPQGLQLPSKIQIQDASVQAGIDQIIEALIRLRASFDGLLREGEIKQCSCGQPDCPCYFFTDRAAFTMDAARQAVLGLAHTLDAHAPEEFYSLE